MDCIWYKYKQQTVTKYWSLLKVEVSVTNKQIAEKKNVSARKNVCTAAIFDCVSRQLELDTP